MDGIDDDITTWLANGDFATWLAYCCLVLYWSGEDDLTDQEHRRGRVQR